MKIGIIGASGKAGSLILKEAKDRGHDVTAIVRNASKVKEQGIAVLEKDVFDLTAADIKPFDVIVNAFGAAPGQEHLHVDAGKALISISKDAQDTRLFVVGGAGSLFVDEAKTTRLIDTPEFPKEYVPTAANQGKIWKISKTQILFPGHSSARQQYLTLKENAQDHIKKGKTI